MSRFIFTCRHKLFVCLYFDLLVYTDIDLCQRVPGLVCGLMIWRAGHADDHVAEAPNSATPGPLGIREQLYAGAPAPTCAAPGSLGIRVPEPAASAPPPANAGARVSAGQLYLCLKHQHVLVVV